MSRMYREQYLRELDKLFTPDCQTVLDVGCGSSSPIKFFTDRFRHTVGVDIHEPSIDMSRSGGIHHDYRCVDVLQIDREFGPRSYECVLLSDVIEHLTKPQGYLLISMAENIARDRVVIFTPNGFLPQTDLRDGNVHQAHVSGWSVKEMRSLGYRVIGINGWKPLRTQQARIAWWPEFLWRRVSFLTENFVTARPELAFQLLCTKELNER